MNTNQLRELIIQPVIASLGLDDADTACNAAELLIMIAAHESNMGEYIKQAGGPALGIYQIEPATHHDLYENYLKYRGWFEVAVLVYASEAPDIATDLIGNLPYQTAIARMILYRDKEALPSYLDRQAMAEYAKRVWNTEKGKATVEDYLTAYNMVF